MVDAGAALPAEPKRSAHQAPVVASVPLATVHDRLETYLSQSAALDLFAPPQDLLWLRCWIEETRPDTILATVAEDGQAVLAIALQVTRKGPFKIARIAGLTHANANFFRLLSATDPAQDDARMRAVIRAIRAARKDIHALVLERLAPDLRGRTNPALTLPSHVNPNIALSVDLRPGFDVVVDYGNGQRKRKRRRYQARRLEALGAIRRFRPQSPKEVAPVIDAFLKMKASRLRQMGIANVFGDQSTGNFFRRLFAEASLSPEPGFVLDALEVGGKLRAITGSSITGERIICDFAAFADDDSAPSSPGDFLLYENIRASALAGFTEYDLGVGDEPYKRSWCDIETRLFDVYAPLTATGYVLVAAQRAKSLLKTAIKSNPTVWRFVKAARAVLIRR